MTTIKLKKAISEDKIWNKIKEALDEHKKRGNNKINSSNIMGCIKKEN